MSPQILNLKLFYIGGVQLDSKNDIKRERDESYNIDGDFYDGNEENCDTIYQENDNEWSDAFLGEDAYYEQNKKGSSSTLDVLGTEYENLEDSYSMYAEQAQEKISLHSNNPIPHKKKYIYRYLLYFVYHFFTTVFYV